MSYRIRLEGELLVLQVLAIPENYSYGYEREGKWRDATIHDIPIANPFERPAACRDVGPG